MVVSYTVRLSVTCVGCGNARPVNGITGGVSCTRCGQAHAFDRAYWQQVFAPEDLAAARGRSSGALRTVMSLTTPRFELQTGCHAPRCPRCASPDLDAAALASFAASGACFCPGCGAPIRVRAAAELCLALVPTARLVVAETASADGPLEARTTPILCACMGCSGALPVDGASRTVTCPHCSAANYLPDGLWLQLNPTPRVQAFFLVCDEPELAPPASSEMSLFD